MRPLREDKEFLLESGIRFDDVDADLTERDLDEQRKKLDARIAAGAAPLLAAPRTSGGLAKGLALAGGGAAIATAIVVAVSLTSPAPEPVPLPAPQAAVLSGLGEALLSEARPELAESATEAETEAATEASSAPDLAADGVETGAIGRSPETGRSAGLASADADLDEVGRPQDERVGARPKQPEARRSRPKPSPAPGPKSSPAPQPKPSPEPEPEPEPVVEAAPEPQGSLAAELALYDKGRAALSAGDAGGAIQAFERYLKTYPRGELAAEARLSLLDAAVRAKRHAQVARVAQSILAGGGAKGRRGEILRVRGEALARLGRCDEALGVLEQAIAAGGSGLTPLSAADRVEACRDAAGAPQ